MVEKLVIARLGRRGEGVADTPAGPVYVPYTLPGEIVEADAWPGHPDRRHLIGIATPSPERTFGSSSRPTYLRWPGRDTRRIA